MVLFANEPTAYRDAMSRAVAERTGLAVSTLRPGRSVDEEVTAAEASVVVTSMPEPDAIRLSARLAVVNLIHEPQERVALYRDGARVREEALEGLGKLAALIEDVAPAGRRA